MKLERSHGHVGRALVAAGVPFVVGPAFSTWWHWSPFDSLVAMQISANLAVSLALHLPTIPTIVWRNDHDLSRWATWIATAGPGAVAIDLSTQRAPADWRWAVSGVAHLNTTLASQDATPRLVVNGPSTTDRMMDIRSVWNGEVTFATQRPWMLAMTGRRLLDDLQNCPDGAPAAELAVANRSTFERVAARMAQLGRGEAASLAV